MTEQEILAEYFRQCAGKGPNVEPVVLAIDGKWFVMTRVPWRSETFNLTLATAYPGAEGKTIVDVVWKENIEKQVRGFIEPFLAASA